MDRSKRKAAVAAYRERKVVSGIYALRCAATGQCWVGRAPDLATIENRMRFTLGHEATTRASLKEALRAHGAASIGFEVLERFGEDDLPYGRDRFLRDRQAAWLVTLEAEPV